MKMKEYSFPPKVLFILQQLNSYGEGFLVGGSVRDILLGKEPKDYDFASNLDYEKLREIFSEYPCIETGKNFGVLRIQMEGEEFEIAKFRNDVGTDGRHPEKVVYVNTIEEDLARRDFTINAMAYNKEKGLVDLYGGFKDLAEKKIQFIGNANTRIEEDGLRIMRAFRFIGQLGFSLEENTKRAITEKKYVLENIAKTRITEEFHKILESNFVRQSLESMKDTEILEWIFPEIKEMYGFDQNNPYHEFDVWEHTLRVVEEVKSEKIIRMAALFHDIAKPRTKTEDAITGYYHFYQHEIVGTEMLENLFSRHLEESNQMKEEVRFLIKNHMAFRKDSGEKNIKKFISKFGEEWTEKLIDLSIADDKGKNRERTSEKEILRKTFQEILEHGKIPTTHTLKITGFHLMELGFRKQEIQRMKEYLLEKVLQEEIENCQEALWEEAKKLSGGK